MEETTDILGIIGSIILVLIIILLCYVRFKFLEHIRKHKVFNREFYIWFPFAYVYYYFKYIRGGKLD